MLQIVLAQVGQDLRPARLLAQLIVVPFGTSLRESFSEGIAVGALAFENPALVNHVNGSALRHEEDRVSALTVASMVASLSFGLEV